MTWQGALATIAVVVLLIWSMRRSAKLKAASQCEVCLRTVPICKTCGRCFDELCNAGCIYCRRSVFR